MFQGSCIVLEGGRFLLDFNKSRVDMVIPAMTTKRIVKGCIISKPIEGKVEKFKTT